MRERLRVASIVLVLLAVALADAGVGARSASRGEQVSSTALRRALAGDPAGRPGKARGTEDRAIVEVGHTLSSGEARAKIERVGGFVTGEVPGVLVQAEVPWSRLRELEHSAGISYVQPPRSINSIPRDPDDGVNRRRKKKKGPVEVVGDEIAKMNAAAWHAAGKRGAGVKVGIIDLFSNKIYKKSLKTGQVPAPAGTACFIAGRTCDALDLFRKERHGTAVAEIVHEMAPDAQLYLAFAETTADLQAVVDYFVQQGVKIVTRSLGSEYDGPGNGTGPLDAVIDNAVSRGIAWFNSAGNSAGTGPFPESGAYYRGAFTDTDRDGLHEFAPGVEFLGVFCNVFSMGLRWDDFNESGAGVTDFDLVAVDRDGDILDSSLNLQGSTGGTAPPIENFAGGGTPCGRPRDLVFLAFRLAAPGSGADDVLEYQNNGTPMTFSSNPFSAAVPVCDSANPGVVCVGAVDPADGIDLASYSSQGPTNDNRIKPDLSVASCVLSFAFRSCFNGTSAASPAAAGAAAIVLGAGLGGGTPAGLGNFLRASVVERGAPGPDNLFGTGELILGPPPA